MTWATEFLRDRNLRMKFAVPILKEPRLLVSGSLIIFFILFSSFAFAFTRTPTITPQVPALSSAGGFADVGGAPDSFSFVVFGDCHVGRSPETDAICRELVSRLNREKDVAFAVNVGDFADHGKKSAYEKYLRIISGLRIKVYHVPGNHDLAGDGYKYYKQMINDKYYYSFDHGNSHFVILNNAYARSFGAKQFAWLKQDLASTKKKHIFVFMHRPMFDPAEIFSGYVMSGREVIKELMRIFDKHGVDYVFAGHIHGYASSRRDSTFYVVSGGGGGPLHLPKDFGGFHHYVKISVEGDKVEDMIVRINE